MLEILIPEVWRAREAAHREALSGPALSYRQRRNVGEKHPVEDFLFQYYPFSPTRLLSWHPGIGVAIQLESGTPIDSLPEHLARPPYRHEATQQIVFADPSLITDGEKERVRFIVQLLENTAARPPQLGCLGLHEWAMVYGLSSDDVRHAGVGLRLDPETIKSVVDSQKLCCTHYDAFRFFTPKAAPQNTKQPTLESRLELEQPGCIHTNMDLYKWAYKLARWIPGELLAECFHFAFRARIIDMRASPYDLAHLNYQPIRLETSEGRDEYRQLQSDLAESGRIVRQRLLIAAQNILAIATSDTKNSTPASPALLSTSHPRS